jgi:hypothetical protein
MENYIRLFVLGDPTFHILPSDVYQEYIDDFKKTLPLKGFLAVIDLAGIRDIQVLFRTFADAFYFPDYFGYNWGAFDECINDLEWIKSGLYLIVIRNFEKLELDNEDLKIFIRILNNTAKKWRNGWYDNPSFPEPPCPFHFIFASVKERVNEVIALLNSGGIQDIDILK